MGQQALVEDWDGLRARIDHQLKNLVNSPDRQATSVHSAFAESITAPGKRIRPMLVHLAAADLAAERDVAIIAGCAVELVHTASLLLDDLPCMDDAQMRRGRPAIHISYGEDVAILTSIALLGEAFAVLSRLDDVPGEQKSAMTAALAESVGISGLVGGQYADLRQASSYRDGQAATEANDRKTGALFVAALRMAASLAGVGSTYRELLDGAGLQLGRAFQLYDDLLDVVGDPVKMGKDGGKDQGKVLLAQYLDQPTMISRIEEHVSLARHAFASLPSGGRRLQGLLDHLFGSLTPMQPAERQLGLMPNLLA